MENKLCRLAIYVEALACWKNRAYT